MKSQQRNHSTDKVTIDYFLYSCFEYENLVRHRPIPPDLRWKLNKESIELGDSTLTQLLDEIIQWYLEKFPILKESQDLDMENLGEVVPAFILLTQDMDTMINFKTGDYLPAYEQGEAEQEPIWSDINEAFTKNFPKLENMFLRYLHWSHASQPQEVDIPAGSRPPVGRYAPNFRRMSSSGNTNKGGPRDKRNNRNDQRKGASKKQNKRPYSNQNKKSDAKLEKESLKQVLLAVQKLNQNSDLHEYRLPPANSFYRRLQHQQIKDEGLFSKSVGEGNERAVVVLKESSPEQDNN